MKEIGILHLLCIVLCLCLNFSGGTLIKERTPDISSPNCKDIVCEQVHEQAKGLSKLALLDEFVSQTVYLLNDLMKNINGELEKSASSLLRYIHPHCDSTQEILKEVIQKQKVRLSIGSSDLSKDVNPMTEDGVDKSIQTNRNEKDGQSYDKQSEDYSQKAWDNYDDGSNLDENSYANYDTSETHNRHSGGSLYTKENAKAGKFGRGWNSQRRDSEEDNDDHYSKEQNKWEGKTWKFDSVGQESTQFKARDSKTIRTEEQKERTSFGPKICKGVEKGSAFWVPGLDKWCQENCSNGYCPKTHCTC